MKILHVGKYYSPYPGGMEGHVQGLAEAAVAQGHSVTVAVSATGLKSTEEWINGVRILRAGRIAHISRTPFCPRLTEYIAKTPADIVHLHIPNPGGVLAWLASGHCSPLVITEHEEVRGRRLLRAMLNPFQRLVLERATSIIATSPNWVEYSDLIRSHKHKVQVVPLGIDTERLQKVEETDVAAIRNLLPAPIALGVGRMVQRKGFDHLVRALPDCDGSLILIGDGPEHGRLAKLVRNLHLENRVFMPGSIPNGAIMPYLHAADAIVMPSLVEAFGLVQLEAMACGKPVINTNLGTGTQFCVLHGRTGLTVDPGNSRQLAESLQYLWHNPEQRVAFGLAGKARVRQEFTAELMTRRTLSVYQLALSGRVENSPELAGVTGYYSPETERVLAEI